MGSAHPAPDDGPGVAQWSVWTTTARLVVTDPAVLDAARRLVEDHLAEVDLAASRFRADSEVRRLAREPGGELAVSERLADLVAVALDAASATGGDVDPTVGGAVAALEDGRALLDPARPAPDRHVTWRDVHLVPTATGTRLRVPRGVLLDLGATAKARAADLCARGVAAAFGCGVLVSLGGDLRVAGPEPASGWGVLVQDGPAEPASTVRLRGASAVATSSTLHRTRWRAGRRLTHVVDPATGDCVGPMWRTVTVAAATCVAANTLTTAALVGGARAVDLLRACRLPARLVGQDGEVLRFGGWPA